MSHNKLKTWLLGGIAGLVIFQGCSGLDTVGNNQTYDLADYLTPETSGIIVYAVYTSQKNKGEGNFSTPEYQGETQYTIERNASNIVETSSESSKHYAVLVDTIAVKDITRDLDYHFDRNVSMMHNFVQESVLRQQVEASGNSTLTYECNATAYLSQMSVEPYPKEYHDVLRVTCVRRHTVYATVDGKRFESIEETREENYLAKSTGLIQSKATTCAYARVDENRQEDDNCERKTYKMVTFVSSN